MKKIFSQAVFIVFLLSFTLSILKVATFAFSELSEEALEELVDLSEEDSEKEYTYSFLNDDFLIVNEGLELSYINDAQQNHIVAADYTEPHPENLYSPPEINV